MILSIESSCDDSSVAVCGICDYSLAFHQKISQDLEHAKYGGVVPEIASRMHAVALPRILANIKSEHFAQIRAIAVTNEPGLSVSLIEGVMMAKALALALDAPLIAVNHLKGHIYSLFLKCEARFPIAILLLSGGHSMILEAHSDKNIRLIANTLDDSFGEAFDKVAKMLYLGYPGGPVVEALARKSRDKTLKFPIPLRDKSLAFSFSGLKNAVRLAIERDKNLAPSDICRAFQESAVEHIAKKVDLYLRASKIKRLGIVGGASANLALRARIQALCEKYDKEILLAPLEFCSDNAVMIGRCAIEAFKNGDFTDINALEVSPKSSIF